MDIRSSEAQYIVGAIKEGKMRMEPGALRDTRHNQVYCRSTTGRFLRIDEDIDQYNTLMPCRTGWQPISGLEPGERRDTTTPFGRLDLLPYRTRCEWLREDVLPNVAITVGLAGIGYVATALIYSVPDVYHFIRNHLPGHQLPHATPQAAAAHPATGSRFMSAFQDMQAPFGVPGEDMYDASDRNHLVDQAMRDMADSAHSARQASSAPYTAREKACMGAGAAVGAGFLGGIAYELASLDDGGPP